MKQRYLEDYGFYPDIIATSCSNSLKIKDVDFRVPCGKCLQCKKKRRQDWGLRLEHEYLGSDSAYFITLTYGEWSVPRTKEGYLTLNKKHLQDYIKRLRNDHIKYVSKELKIPKKEVKNVSKPIRYYAVGEYGSKTRRPHYHLLLFNYDIGNVRSIITQWKDTTTGLPYGNVDIGKDPKTGQLGGVRAKSINYVTKYMHKQFNLKTDKRNPPFTLMSKGRRFKEDGVTPNEWSILGSFYLNNYGKYHKVNESLDTVDMAGNKRRLPRAYIKRLWEDKQKRQQISQESYQKHIEKKVDQFHKKLNDYYKGDVVEWQRSKDADNHRLLTNIINSETL